MIDLTTAISIFALAPSGFYAGASPSAPSVHLTLRSGKVVQASAWTRTYTCALGGNLGAAEVSVNPRTRVASNGAINFESGRPSRRLRARLKYSRGRISGNVRLVGEIGGGSRCQSPLINITLLRK
ncbi:MAG: hypothetical protein WCL20_01825 [Actinomycetes bacterium]|nr:hypothetical protein [Solirubrobacterales bacterium]